MLKKVWSSPEAIPQLLKSSTGILVVEGKTDRCTIDIFSVFKSRGK